MLLLLCAQSMCFKYDPKTKTSHVLMKHKNDLTIDDENSKKVSLRERMYHETSNDKSETTIKEEIARSTLTLPTFKRSSASNDSISLSLRALSIMLYS